MQQPTPSPEIPSSARENLELLANFAERETQKIPGIQLAIERISKFFGSPAYFIFVSAFICLWVAFNLWAARAGWRTLDEPPFPWLQGLVSSNALLLTVAVLIRQNRMSQQEEHRAHLDLQINLLTEQKVSKILQIADELHREVRSLRGKPAAQAPERMEEMTKPSDPHAILHAIKQQTGEK